MLLLQGVFRSGTTVLFRTLRRDRRLRCYYEPLHPNLLDHAREACALSPDHPKSPLYEEYAPLLDRLEQHLGPEGPSWPCSLDEDDESSLLKQYLHCLTDADGTPLLQFNRAFWMASWLTQTFSRSPFVQLVRDPRSVVWSQLTTASGDRVRMDWPLLGRLVPFTSGTLRHAFSRHAYFGAYQLDDYYEAGRQLLSSGPQTPVPDSSLRRLEAVRNAPPYVKALALWGAQVETCRRARAASETQSLLLRYEDFCDAPCEHLHSLYALQNRTPPRPVRNYAQRSVEADRLRQWTDVPTAKRRFREGIRRAQIGELMRDLGYSPSGTWA